MKAGTHVIQAVVNLKCSRFKCKFHKKKPKNIASYLNLQLKSYISNFVTPFFSPWLIAALQHPFLAKLWLSVMKSEVVVQNGWLNWRYSVRQVWSAKPTYQPARCQQPPSSRPLCNSSLPGLVSTAVWVTVNPFFVPQQRLAGLCCTESFQVSLTWDVAVKIEKKWAVEKKKLTGCFCVLLVQN